MLQERPGNNVINNYKGVMLCSRPNEVQASSNEKPFCARVIPSQQLGLVPCKIQSFGQRQFRKPKLQILDRHKKWLASFKNGMNKKKQYQQEQKKQEQQKVKRIKQIAENDRQRSRKMKQEYNQAATNVLNILDDKQTPKITSNEITAQNLQKLNKINQIKDQEQKSIKQNNNDQKFKKKKKGQKEKPLWAYTEDQYQQKQDKQVDQLLNFFENNHVQDYEQDQQVKQILRNLKDKIQVLKQQEDWKLKESQKINKKRQEQKLRRQASKNQEDDDDKQSHYSQQSEGKSVASERTQKKIEELKAKKNEQQEWDKFTTSQKSSVANIDQKIAKNIADQVLRNYPNMKGVHSNVSIRKLLQQQAAKVMNQPIMRPVITTVIRQKQPMNANTLPYLHRNPAI